MFILKVPSKGSKDFFLKGAKVPSKGTKKFFLKGLKVPNKANQAE